MSTQGISSEVGTLHVDFNSGRSHLFDAVKVGDQLWANDGEGMRCRAVVTGVRMSEHSVGCVIIDAEGDYSTLEDLVDGAWVPRADQP